MLRISEDALETFLLVTIALFTALAIVCILVVFRKRNKKIVWKKKKAAFTAEIEALLFEVIFGENELKVLIADPKNRALLTEPLHHKTLLTQTMQLHQTYSGAASIRLEEFYIQSGLINLSFKKLKSSQWNRKCEAIRELSEMRVKGSIGLISKEFNSSHKIVQLESLVALIRLEGLSGLKVLENYKGPINDWIQINVLFELRKTDQTDVQEFNNLLASQNDSVVIFALRLISNYRQKQFVTDITRLIQTTHSKEIKRQAIQTLADFELQ